MKLLNSSINERKQIRRFVTRCINELFHVVSIGDPEEEAQKQIEAYVYSLTGYHPAVLVMWGFTFKGDVVKVNIGYGNPIKIIKLRIEL